LLNDLTALHAAEVITKIPLPLNGPRGLDLAPDARQLAVTGYFSGNLVLVDAVAGKVTSTISLGPAPEPDMVRRGEMIFHDATYCYQHWSSCATCHPDGGSDGLSWDLQSYDVGTRGALDHVGELDRPTLIELWRTAPYLHDGCAGTVGEVLTKRNRKDQHGQTSHLTDEQLHDLIEFVLSR